MKRTKKSIETKCERANTMIRLSDKAGALKLMRVLPGYGYKVIVTGPVRRESSIGTLQVCEEFIEGIALGFDLRAREGK